MSLYSCVDNLENCLNKLEKRTLVAKRHISHTRLVKVQKQHQADINFITELRDRLNRRGIQDDYDNLDKEINLITQFLANSPLTSVDHDLRIINTKLKLIIEDIINMKLQAMPSSNVLMPAAHFSHIATKPFVYIKLGQTSEPRFGLSKGECGGYVMALAEKLDTDDEPDLTQLTAFKLNKIIHDYQRNQRVRNKDQGKIKSVRLTRVHFYADYRQQATEILAIASKNTGKGLELIRHSEGGAHACYLRRSSSDGSIIYMDPNEGLFKFQNQEDFISIYSSFSKLDVQNRGKLFRFNRYELRELRVERPSQSLSESITWAGKVRSLLTGEKYKGFGFHLTKFASDAFNFVVGGAIGAGIAALVTTIMTAAAPAFMSAVVGSVIFPIPIIGAVIGVVLGCTLSLMAYKNGHRGILAVPHYLQERWQDFKGWIGSFSSKKQIEISTHPQDHIVTKPTNNEAHQTIEATQVVSSTTTMLEQLNESSIQSSSEPGLIHEAVEQEASTSIVPDQLVAVNHDIKEEVPPSLRLEYGDRP